MRIRIERLRVWLLASAGLLVVVIAGFIGAARYLRRHWLAAIPAKLGENVKIDTSGITWSHTYQGQTDLVVHAAKDIEHTDGTFALHDVWMKLCGRQQKRADMVRGDDWEWDQKTGVIRALGVVHIELRDAAATHGCTAADDSGVGRDGANALRVTTSNLVYMDNLGVAATSAPIEFASGTMQGHAVGADYASDSGTLMLHSAVSMTGFSAGEAVELNAGSAEMDGQERLVRLTAATYTTGSGVSARTAAAQQAVLHLRADRTLERIEAQGDVTMEAGGGKVTSAKADVAMNAAGHPVNALLAGGVRYAANGPLAERQGEAETAAITFDGKASPQAERAVFTGAAHFMEKTQTEGEAAWNTRELSAAKVDAKLVADTAGRNEVQDAEATGGARFAEVSAMKTASAGGGAAGSETTEIAADDLKAHFAAGSGASPRAQLEILSGRGHTLVRQVNAAGVEQTSAADSLEARFRQATAGRTQKNREKTPADGDDFSGSDDLASAVQTGHVVVTRKDPAKDAKDGRGVLGAAVQKVRVQEARAQEASYDGDTHLVTLTGGVQLTDASGQLWAGRVALERGTGNAQAVGAVKAEFVPATSGAGQDARAKDTGPTHVLAERGDLNHATDVVTFHGSPARMWQGGSQVQAPVIELERTARRLMARGESGNGRGAAQSFPVRTVLTSANRPAGQARAVEGGTQACAVNSGTGSGATSAQNLTRQQVMRIASGGLVYSEAAGAADFTGGFRAETADATIRADAGTVYLKDAKGSLKTAGAPPGAGDRQGTPAREGDVERVVATGQVAVSRAGLSATGERLLYTAAEQQFLLTGDAKNPPRAVNARGDVTTGAAIEFHRTCGGTGGDTVEVLNKVPGGSDVPVGGVHTEARAEAKRGQ